MWPVKNSLDYPHRLFQPSGDTVKRCCRCSFKDLSVCSVLSVTELVTGKNIWLNKKKLKHSFVASHGIAAH